MAGIRRRLRSAMIIGSGVAGVAALASSAYQESAARRDRRRFAPLGRLVRVNGRNLHLLDAGQGTPTIVIVPALGCGVLFWERIQRELATGMRVIVYDRAGLGWSDPPGPGWRTCDDRAEELRGLLEAAAIDPPYVLLAHSLGGVFARRFAARYPHMVAGLILVDSSHEDQANREGRAVCYKAALKWQCSVLGLRRLRARLGLLKELDYDQAREAVPEHAAQYRASMLSTRERRAVVTELLLMSTLSGSPPPLNSLPLTVITAGNQNRPSWRKMQEELAALSDDSVHIVAEGAGHDVHVDASPPCYQAGVVKGREVADAAGRPVLDALAAWSRPLAGEPHGFVRL